MLDTMEQPLLLPKLQTALSCLYGNSNSQNPQNRAEAHDFLLGFKSSNIRRAVWSRIQSQKDRVRSGESISSIFEEPFDEDRGGSIYLSCLALILQSCSTRNADGRGSHERIFAAQTLNHRCRSIKLTETLDVEAEDGVECGVARLVVAFEELRMERASVNADQNALGEKTKMILTAWLERYATMLVNRCGGVGDGASSTSEATLCNGPELLALVVQRHSSSLTNNLEDERGEEYIKGTLMMLNLATAMYACAFCDYEEEHQYHQTQQQNHQARSPWANSVLADLGSALSISALRIRYRPTVDKYATPAPEPSCPPLIDMLVNAVNVVKESAEVYFSQKMQQLQHQPNQQTIQNAIHQAHQYAIQRSIAACMKALPETVLLPPGQEDIGHRVPSVDRASLRAASMELRAVGSDCKTEVGTGMDKAWKVLMESEYGNGNQLQGNLQDLSATRLLECCEAWARFVAVPIPIIEVTVGSLAVGYLHISRETTHPQQKQKAQSAAFQYLVSIFDSASQSLTPDNILTAALGVGSGANGAGKKNTKKKQGNRSRKRHEERLGRAIATNDGQDGSAADAADKELMARRNAACIAAAAVFGISLEDSSIMGDDWGLRLAATSQSMSSHGICSTVAAAATTVLPHLLCLERGNEGGDSSHEWRAELFSAIMAVIRRMCGSPIRELRALAYEPLMMLHTSLNSVAHVSLRIEQVAVDAICECVLALATSCGYPAGYFDCLTENNDDELEIERNDVRDVVRSVCSLDAGPIETQGQKSPSILILEHFISACNSAVQESTQTSQLPPETAIHVLSSLAKPLNKLGKKYNEHPSAIACEIITATLQVLGCVCAQLNSAFDSLHMSQIIPVSRLALMGTASLAPLYSSLAEVSTRPATSEVEKDMLATFERTLLSSLQHTLLSTAKIPELVAKSILDSSRYDIKGTMRCPGGEDHVGCIALLRLSQESDHLITSIFNVYGAAILHDLSSLYQGLKASELERGVNCDYGVGVAPISRRIILRVVSRLASHDQSSEGRAVLHQLLQAPLCELRSLKEAPDSAEKLFRLCETAYDLSFFAPKVIADLLNGQADAIAISLVFECVIAGYSRLSFACDADAMCQQWGRLRGGAHSVMRASLKEALSDYSSSIISALIKAECEAATLQSNQGPSSGSNVFVDGVAGDEMVNAGVYITLIKDCLDRIAKMKSQTDQSIDESRRCLLVLKDVAPMVIPLLLHQSPEANCHVDPRPTFAEAWFLTIESLVSVCRKQEQIAASLVGDSIESFLGESLATAMSLIFLKDLGTKKVSPPAIQQGMSLDGPQTLAIMSFISSALLLGPNILLAGGRKAMSAIQVQSTDQNNIGAVILTASLLRGVAGALPPWAVEETPDLFKSFYLAMGSNCDILIQIMSASTKVKAVAPFGGIREGELLAGRYLDVSDSHIKAFLSQSKEVCIKGNWNKLKVILKATCGGKKKDSGFNLKPRFTSWECERL